MNLKHWMIVPAAVCLTASAAIVRADRAPGWMVGTFKGYNTKYAIEVTIRVKANGDLSTRSSKGDKETGYYRNGELIIGKTSYYLSRRADGFRLVETADRSNTADYSRSGGSRYPGGSNIGGVVPDRAPEWIQGVFSGYNETYKRDVEVTVAPDGAITARSRDAKGRETTETGYYSDGQITIGRATYYADQAGNGFRLSEVDDRANTTTYRRVGATGGDAPAQRPPSALVGRYHGRNSKYNVLLDLEIRPSGSVIVKGRTDTGKYTSETGTYSRGRIYLNTTSYRVDRTGTGLRLIEINDPSNTAFYRRF